jgi:hypothetical protein
MTDFVLLEENAFYATRNNLPGNGLIHRLNELRRAGWYRQKTISEFSKPVFDFAENICTFAHHSFSK